jgi:Sortase domain
LGRLPVDARAVAQRSLPNRRLVLPLLLAAALAAEVTGLAIARAATPHPVTDAARTGPDPATSAVREPGSVAYLAVSFVPSRGDRLVDAARDVTFVAGRDATGDPATAVDGRLSGRLAGPAAATKVSTPAPKASTAYHGKNHVWIPSLGINRALKAFPCSRTRPPDNYVYRWGCSGRNNVYLLGHAYSVFKPLHDAYVGGRLHTGMKVIYADGAGRVHTYAVIWWKVVAPTTAASWAWAAQTRPSMTLQTCVGSRSQYRLMVRLVQVG